MDLATALHAAVSLFALFACAAVARVIARREAGPRLHDARLMLLSWWTGAAVSNGAAALAILPLPLGVFAEGIVLAFLAGGTLSAIAMLLHVLHVFDGGTFGGRVTLALGTIVTTGVLALGFGGSLEFPSASIDASVETKRAFLSVALVLHGIPALVALAYGGLALETTRNADRERLHRLAGGLVVWSAAGILVIIATFERLDLARLAALGLLVIGTAACATYYAPAHDLFRSARVATP